MSIADAIDKQEFENAGREIVLTVEKVVGDPVGRMYIDGDMKVDKDLGTDGQMDAFMTIVNNNLIGEDGIEIPEGWEDIIASFRSWSYNETTGQMVKS